MLSYSTRPLWDKPLGPHTTLPHYYAQGVPFDSHLCGLHGWKSRDTASSPLPDVWDAVLFSSELDLLEIRLHELDPIVSKFFIVEADRTFTGIPKNLTFATHADRFAQFAHKIVHSVFHPRELAPGENPFENEVEQRQHMDALLREHHASMKKPPGTLVSDITPPSVSPPPPLVVFSDVDEIPYAHTIQLLRHCSAPLPMHLQMREYLYSFEWPAGEGSWRAQVHQLEEDELEGGGYEFGYGHAQVSEWKLADAGWHCSFCFRYLHEFVDKMIGTSSLYFPAENVNGVWNCG